MGDYSNIQFNSAYSKANFSKDDIIKNNYNYCQKVDLRRTVKDRSLSVMYWLPQPHKTPIGARFIDDDDDDDDDDDYTDDDESFLWYH